MINEKRTLVCVFSLPLIVDEIARYAQFFPKMGYAVAPQNSVVHGFMAADAMYGVPTGPVGDVGTR